MATSLFRKQGEQLTKVTTSNGITTVVPNAGGALYYYQSGTTTPQTTFSNAAGTIPNTNPLVLDSDGRLQTPVYLGDSDSYSAYTEDHKNSDGVAVSTLWPVDGIPAATPAAAAASTFAYPSVPWEAITSASSPVTILTADAGSAYETDTTGGSVTFNLPSAVSVGVGKSIWFKKTSSANSLILHPSGTQEIDGVNADYTITRGQATFLLTSNGANWKITTSSYRMPPVSIGGFKNLVCTNNAAAPNTKWDVDAYGAILEGTDGEYITTGTVNLTIDSGATGANGLDTGVLAAATWYAVWVISNGTTTAGLLSLSYTSPTMPSGYTYKCYAGSITTDSAAASFEMIRQVGNTSQYKVVAASTTPNLPFMDSGAKGNVATPTWQSVAIAAYIPTSAIIIMMSLYSGGSAIVAPNNDYGAYNSATNPPPAVLNAASYACIVPLVVESANCLLGVE